MVRSSETMTEAKKEKKKSKDKMQDSIHYVKKGGKFVPVGQTNIKKKFPRATVRNLKSINNYLKVMSKSEPEFMVESLEKCNNPDFDLVCKCVNDIVHDSGVMKGKLSDSEFETLKGLVQPYKKDLGNFTNLKRSSTYRKKLLRKAFKTTDKEKDKDQQGSGTFGEIVSNLLPMAVSALAGLL